MGRHSRRGPVPKNDSADIAARRREQRDDRSGDARDLPGQGGGPASQEEGAYGVRPVLPGQRQAPPGRRQAPPAHGTPGFGDGTPVRGVPRLPDGTPAHGVPRFPDGTPVRGVPRVPDGTPGLGVPRLPEGTPGRGVPRFPGGAAARGGHPEQREAGGGWGEFAGVAGTASSRQRPAGPGRAGGPRQEYLDAFAGGRAGDVDARDDADVFAPRVGKPRTADEHAADAPEADGRGGRTPSGPPATATHPQGDGSTSPGAPRGRALAGIAAAAVTTVLAVVVAGQVTESRDGGAAQSRSATDQARDAHTPAGQAPSASPGTATLSYEQRMDRTYPLSATLKASGKFEAVPGFAKAPGKGQKYTYRVDVEQGLGLDGELFAEAVQKTLNDDRSWAHGGARTFERISSGKPDFVITLASPGTTAKWCAKSGLDTTEDNVSCDSAATERVMINAYRWAQGSKTYGDKIYAYRQMLINHEVGHRLGHGHVTCQKNGELAPVMQQQTKFLDHDGIHCLPNPWPYPRS
ncbi:hypothetical protein GCM10010260_11800 [Streptomyces filipinensis]|uniref:DUF3152 domain-containing protein n=1 Tax=Streptomyces filipinensis TaxID=66887 RepID=A0A918M8K7_9ACTN|nr:DUF3152 domain-containing protein [Streptomyces filipinensis]GGU81127.1 hypothetical protein GCM10010260_11800 [Streptomyces filipinensis]